MPDPFSHMRLALLVAAGMSSAEAQRAAVSPFMVHLSGDVRRGGCAECPVRVRRAVVISAGLRDVARTLMIPVDDLVGAFEGRLQIDSSGRRLDIHVGRCTWCILEPSPGSALDRSTL